MKTPNGPTTMKVVKTLKLDRETVASLRTRTSLRTGLMNPVATNQKAASCGSVPVEC
jgi:hypothetical protein